MARRASNVWLGLMALVISSFLWFMAHSASTVERGYDVPILFDRLPENLVITGQSADVVNIQVQGNRAAHREISPAQVEYVVDVSEARPGPAVYEVDRSRIEERLPRGAQITSRSPASVQVTFERRGRKSVQIRADLEGEPAEGYAVKSVAVDPPRVWLVGARSAVLRLSEVVTETIPLQGLTESTERQVRLSLGSGHVWMEEQRPVTVRIEIEAPEPAEGTAEGPVQERTG